jgi:hypothetical protein
MHFLTFTKTQNLIKNEALLHKKYCSLDISGKSIWRLHSLRKKPEFNNTLQIITSEITTKLKSGTKIKNCQVRFLSQMKNTVI